MTQDANALVWMDLEMTGLYPDHDRIIEIASVVTDSDLNIVAEGPVIAIHQPPELLDAMDEWNTTTHTETGLVERVRASEVSEREAEEQTIAFLSEYVQKGRSPLCGNSISQDRRFLYRYMPELQDFMHYRNLDVSSVKELALRWYPEIAAQLEKRNTHRALDDIRESIEELKFYREHIFRC